MKNIQEIELSGSGDNNHLKIYEREEAGLEGVKTGKQKLFIAVTGGGLSTILDATAKGGRSGVYAGQYIPYDTRQTDVFLGKKPERYVSEYTGRLLAMKSYEQVQVSLSDGYSGLGIGSTSSLAKSGPEPEREGRTHKIIVSTQGDQATTSLEILLQQARTREEEEALARNLIANEISYVTGNSYDHVESIGLNSNEKLRRKVAYGTEETMALLQNKEVLGFSKIPLRGDIVIFPGSFRPAHKGHFGMENYLQSNGLLQDKTFLYELSTSNVDKPPLDYIEINKRVSTLENDYNKHVFLTNQPTFIGKIKALSKHKEVGNIQIVVGADTRERVLQPKYYDSIEDMYAFLKDCEERGVEFLVFPRESGGILQDGAKINAQHSHIENLLSNITICVSANDFNMPISSTQIRKSNNS